jgi:hypothetical protein
MKQFLTLGSFAFAFSLATAMAQTNAAPADVAAAPVAKHPILFHPPSDVSEGVQTNRVGGGSRGIGDGNITLEVLVPNQVALTTQASPSLYWYQSAEAKTKCEITVTEPKKPKPLLALKTGDSTPAGIHAIRLSKFNVTLKPNVVYKWSVAVVLDSNSRSGDIIAQGTIKRIEPSADLAGKLGGASDADKAAIFAENGIWYDALQAVSDQIDKNPQDASLKQQRADLLKQVGMDDVKVTDTPSKAP